MLAGKASEFMDNKMPVGIGAFLALFLAFPFIAQQLRDKPAEDAIVTENASATPTTFMNIPNEPPLWNAMNIIGTGWKVNWEGRDLKLVIMPDGVCHVYHPLMRQVAGKDFVEGQWRLDYDKAYVDIVFGTQEYHFVLTIRGYNVYDPDGKPIERYS